MFTYLIKANLLLVIVWLFCRFVLGSDRHFSWRRLALLGGIGLALLFPLFSLLPRAPLHFISDGGIHVIGRTIDIYSGHHVSEYVVGNPWSVTHWVILIYFSVSIALFVRMLIRLASIWMIVRTGRRDTVFGIPVLRIPRTYGSVFSFFHYIFVPDGAQIAEEYVMRHELAHVRQWHSANVLISELLVIIFWYNPAAWMLRREIRDNIEFMADAASVGRDNKYQYQMSLINNISTKAIAKFYNNFNVSSVKRRIKMMNLKNSTTGAFRYLAALPVIGMMFIVGCSGSGDSRAEEQAGTAAEVVEESAAEAVKMDTVTETLVTQKDSTVVVTDGDAAEFPGGYVKFMEFMMRNLVYPESAAKDNIQGKVLVSFTVDKTGAVVNPRVIKGVRADLDSAAISVIRKSPKWKPAPSGNDCTVNLPVNFKLQ